MDFERVRQIGHELPGVEDGTSYGTPGLKVRGKFLSTVTEPVLREMMTNAWRRVAPKKLLALLERPDD